MILIFHDCSLPLYISRMWRNGQEETGCLHSKLHAQKDKAYLVEKATHAAECALEDQLESIRLHLASSTLMDDISPSPLTSVPGGRMWGCVLQESLPNTVDISNLLTFLSRTHLYSAKPIEQN